MNEDFTPKGETAARERFMEECRQAPIRAASAVTGSTALAIELGECRRQLDAARRVGLEAAHQRDVAKEELSDMRSENNHHRLMASALLRQRRAVLDVARCLPNLTIEDLKRLEEAANQK